MNAEKRRVALVTGGSSGIGRETARSLRDAGCRVYELSRHDTKPEGIVHLTADVTDEQSVKEAVSEILRAEGQIDILVCCAGFGISGAAEMTDPADAERQMAVNLFGTDRVIRAVLPGMREREAGRIVCISSVAGALPIPFQLWYSVSKSAILSYCLALQNEVRPYGVTVCAALPGDIQTGFTDARKRSAAGDDVYGGRIACSVSVMEHDERTGWQASRAGKMIARLALKRRSRPFVTLGFGYGLATFAAKILPRRFTNWLIGLIYAK